MRLIWPGKRLLSGILTGLLFASSLRAAQPPPPPNAGSVALGWTASTDPTATGYEILYGTNSAALTNTIDVGTNTTYTVTGLTPGATYYFAAVSYNMSGADSVPTAQVAYIVPGVITLSSFTGTCATANLQFPFAPSTTYQIQASSDLKTWTSIWNYVSGNSNGLAQFSEPVTNTTQARFYRLISH